MYCLADIPAPAGDAVAGASSAMMVQRSEWWQMGLAGIVFAWSVMVARDWI